VATEVQLGIHDSRRADRETCRGEGKVSGLAWLRPPRRFGLLTQLLVGFSAGGLLVTIFLVVGDTMFRSTSQHLVLTLEDHVRPLARLHRLQSRIAELRTQELELASLRDVFVVQTQAASMRGEINSIDEEIRSFAFRLAGRSRSDAERLQGHWVDYRTRLTEQVRHAAEMDLEAVRRISSSGSQLPFAAIQSVLDEVSQRTERAAEKAYQDTMAEQAGQRRSLMVLIMLGSLLMLAGLAWAGRSVVRRIQILHGHAQKLAAGEGSGGIEISRHDEIGDLAEAFSAMREQVMTREADLLAARAELEARVEARTLDLRRANAGLVLFSQAVEQSPVGILIANLGGRVEFVNAAYLRITGRTQDEVLASRFVDVIRSGDAIDADEAVRMAKRGDRPWEAEQRNLRPDGTEYWERLRLQAVNDARGAVTHLLLSREDISERHRQQERIAFQAHYDALTGLPNRVLAHDRLAQATGRARRDGGKAVAMFIDLDNFKQINDTLGHAAGDDLLRQAANRLRAAVRDEDTVARLGGDEFLIIVGGVTHANDAGAIAEKVIAAFASPFAVDERELVSSPSIGIAVYPDDGTEPMVLLRNADLAMYEAKEGGRNTYRYFNQSIHDLSLQRLEVGRCLRGALERNELHVVYHPLVAAATGRIVGAEALLRWISPELGNVSPETFIPIAEQNGLIIDLGRWVLREAAAMLANWDRKQPGFTMAINVSPRQFRSQGFVDTVRDCLAEFGVPPKQLEIEITEGVLLRNQGEVGEILARLDTLGVRLSMDDFGTGYSSLSYLREFPFHTIKIDRSFIRDVSDDRSDRALVVAAVRMAQAMGLQIIAEGVETDEQWAFLADQDCNILQGYRFGLPVIASEFEPHWVNASVTPPVSQVPSGAQPDAVVGT
jgi:diguanylate cyclase (GGDEF)-like protein/PAS domain S-box-containing protein